MFNFFKRNKSNVSKTTNKQVFYNEKNALVIHFKCTKCGEKFRSYLRKGYDFVTDYETGEYKINKEYIGSNCFNKIHLSATFDRNYKLKEYTLENGKVISKEEWEGKDDA
ncbi:hypothetical protein [Petrotoga olearia]|uniref:Uncharacterized protein n=2 Tax=Petrotoga olearia TaxID=156203 RepID=A0A2K1NY60_9BACT|nr:hypothetical protein [Petrotoga olearia]PNR95470.1 hypothetical protein X929_07700 [Petrotoga olearia DSM 13574]RMA72675.1 hypothetical protein C8D75_1341 [Petrotoga olearia]